MSSRPAQDINFQSPTRNRHHESSLQLARTTRIQSCVRLPRLDVLQLFVTLATLNPVIGLAVEDLAITLPVREGYPAQLLRDCLRLTPNVTSLLLNLPTSSPVTLLSGFNFPRLKVFSSNLPHRILPIFLAQHASISSLALDACGTHSLCPLRDLDLAHVTDLKCPARCLQGLANSQVTVATINLTRMASLAALAIRALSSSPLYSLTVDFFPDDLDILSRIATAAPQLRKLKLIEKPRAQWRFHHARRPWNNLQEWHRTLLLLSFLEELMLRTPTAITGPRRSEDLVVTSWASGHGQRSGRHPNLYHVSILQRGDGPNMQALSHWFRRGGIWEQVSAAHVTAADSFVL